MKEAKRKSQQKEKSPRRALSEPHILVLVESFSGYGRDILRGITQYELENGPWSVYAEVRSFSRGMPFHLDKWKGDGVLARTTSHSMERCFLKSRIPVIDLLGMREETELPKVHNDNLYNGQLAARHLMNCGIRHFGFFTFGTPWWIQMQERGFSEEIAGKGSYSRHVSFPKSSLLRPSWNIGHGAKLVRWLRDLPKPVGIFAAPIDAARLLLTFCREEGLLVPDEVAVLTDSNDDCLCMLSTPPLSAIQSSGYQVGYEAAALLDQAIKSGERPVGNRWIRTTGIVVRKSTDTIAVEHPDLVSAIRYIRENVDIPLSVKDVCDVLCISRRNLERLFTKYLNRTPLDEIRQNQIRRISQLLLSTDLPIEQIAIRSGFSPGKYFYTFFMEHFGCTPREYRQFHLKKGTDSLSAIF